MQDTKRSYHNCPCRSTLVPSCFLCEPSSSQIWHPLLIAECAHTMSDKQAEKMATFSIVGFYLSYTDCNPASRISNNTKPLNDQSS